jgi:UDP-N-acetylmuramyl pentapeptide phosphotransferase/UDP-N-acetylglucosamine-1-phosphate transferase
MTAAPIVLLSFVFGWTLLYALLPFLRRYFLDFLNSRSSHAQPTPRGGGIAFVVVASISSAIALLVGQSFWPAAIALLCVPLAVIGLLDDRYNLPASWRYGVQLSTAASVILFSPLVRLAGQSATYGGWFLLLAFVLLLIVVTAVINFTNFMDGLDGLVAGCMVVAISAVMIELSAPWSLWALVGSLLGFLLWNWSPAKVFMGDVGSTFLGAVFAGLVLQAPSWPEALGLLLVATPLLGDACLCVSRRLLAGQQVFQAHRLHLFQRLHQAGWPHARVSSLYIAATAVLAVALLWGGLAWLITLSAFELLLGIWLDQRVAVPFAISSRS